MSAPAPALLVVADELRKVDRALRDARGVVRRSRGVHGFAPPATVRSLLALRSERCRLRSAVWRLAEELADDIYRCTTDAVLAELDPVDVDEWAAVVLQDSIDLRSFLQLAGTFPRSFGRPAVVLRRLSRLAERGATEARRRAPNARPLGRVD